MSKKNYLDELMETLAPQQQLSQLLKDKIVEIKKIVDSDNTISELDKINFKIEVIRTTQELFTVEKVLKEKEDYFKKYAIQFEKDYQEANQRYKQVIEKAKIKAKTDATVKSLLEKVNFQAIETSKELKVTFYKRFKNLV
jgi:hypothetical protein